LINHVHFILLYLIILKIEKASKLLKKYIFNIVEDSKWVKKKQ